MPESDTLAFFDAVPVRGVGRREAYLAGRVFALADVFQRPMEQRYRSVLSREELEWFDAGFDSIRNPVIGRP
jgi:hypothetical protein